VTTHPRARAVQAGALLALVSGFLMVGAAPAQAEAPSVQITGVSATNVRSGEKTRIRYRVTNLTPPGQSGEIRVQVSGMDCTDGDCSPAEEIGFNQSREFAAELTAPDVGAGATRSVRVQVQASSGDDTSAANTTITVRGPDKPRSVRQISGRVRDADGDPISGAQVVMKDSAGNTYDTTSNGDGGYSITSSGSRPITPGAISIGAGKDGYQPQAVNVQAGAGKTVNVPLTLKKIAAATPSATPTEDDTASAAPLDEESAAVTDQQTAGADPQEAANASDDGNGSLLFIILGGLLVAAGVGAIVLVLMRRRNNGEDDGDGDFPPGGGPMPPGQSRYATDATRVAAPVGGRANDATMVAGMPAPGSMSDAPTMLQRPVSPDDEFPDPYGAPPRPQVPTYGGGTYGGAAQAAAPQVPAQSGGYDDGYAGPPTRYGRPVPDDDQYAAYGAYNGGGQQQPQPYDEPTGMYRPQSDYDRGGYGGQGGYEQPGVGYEQPGAGYEQPGAGYEQPGYGSHGQPAGGLDSGNAYGPASGGSYGGGGYDQGYDQRAGYDQGGYGGPGGYDQRAGGYEQGGYDQPGAGYQQGGYDQPGAGYQPGYDQGGYDRGYPPGGGGYDDDPNGGQPPRPGKRRSVNWMDD
jgi:hypothetical protein